MVDETSLDTLLEAWPGYSGDSFCWRGEEKKELIAREEEITRQERRASCLFSLRRS
jgi:hypothetical protein